MSFLAPWMLAAGALAALAIVALHLLSTRRPPRAVLPTARFVPESEARAVSRSSKPTDLLLLACRVAAVLLLAAAFARPVPDAPGPSVRTVALVDLSSGVADRAAALREAAARAGAGGVLVVFDSTARVAATDAVAALDISPAVRAADGILSAALVAGLREARAIARGADSVRMVLVSPMAASSFDAATASARAAWPGAIEVARVAAVVDSARGAAPVLDSPLDDDPLAPALAALGSIRGGHAVRIVRRAPSAGDSAWAREPGRVLVHWPLAANAAPHADAVTAFGLQVATVVAPLVRLDAARDPSEGSSAGTAEPAGARVLARWRDGAVAAAEHALGAGCVREVGVGIPLAGDLTLRPAFHAFLGVMLEPCGGARGPVVDDSTAAAFAGGTSAVNARLLVAAGASDRDLAAWLLAAALLALAAEWYVRRRRAA